jgi:hypothetical protein
MFLHKYVPIIAALVFMVPGCDNSEDGPLCLDDCTLCAQGKCPDNRCGLLVILSHDCENKVSYAEVAVDQCLEEQELTPASSLVTCATIEENKQRVITVRGTGEQDWVWRRTVECTAAEAGQLIPVALYCVDVNE